MTIGANKKNKDNRNMPIIGDKVVIYNNSSVLGPVTIGDNVVIGAHTLVNKDFKSNVTVIGVPGKVLP